MLWLCLHLPKLPLEIFTRAHCAPEASAARALVIGEGQGRTQQVLMPNAAAARAGIQPGMPLAAAHALAAKLQVIGRDVIAERQTLEHTAAWAGQFTSHVSLESPQALLLEVEGSLRLFGGLGVLYRALRTGVTELGFTAVLSVAPTPLAALWLARAGDETPVVDMPALTGRLFDLPLTYLGLDRLQQEQLRGMGLATLGECLRLPRDGLARRFGAEFIAALDAAFGRRSDPRTLFVAPPTYNARLAIPGAVHTTEGLMFPLNRLLRELNGFLIARVAGVQELTLTLRHNKAPATRIELGLARPVRDTAHLAGLFRERFASVRLPEPVEEIMLAAPRLLPLAESERDFFMTPGSSAEATSELIERLGARLGRQAVRGLAVLAEHRPERAWRYTEPAAPQSTPSPRTMAERPLWLLTEPMPLDTRNGQPTLDGALDLEPDVERIESGWWDGHDARRDYFVARDTNGACLWIYRELVAEGRWWLQGVFG